MPTHAHQSGRHMWVGVWTRSRHLLLGGEPGDTATWQNSRAGSWDVAPHTVLSCSPSDTETVA